jgi:hypothetical protein
MHCDICHKREATVHLTSVTPDEVLGRRNLCEVCFPAGTMSKQEMEAAALKLIPHPPTKEGGASGGGRAVKADNEADAQDPAITSLFQIGHRGRGVCDLRRSTDTQRRLTQ